jgi:hypothetical protein
VQAHQRRHRDSRRDHEPAALDPAQNRRGHRLGGHQPARSREPVADLGPVPQFFPIARR